tara:strand:+ start:479 stop:664 length:186 start_codon:yes stop_codon:yes gene_type:complete
MEDSGEDLEKEEVTEVMEEVEATVVEMVVGEKEVEKGVLLQSQSCSSRMHSDSNRKNEDVK